MFQNLGDGVRRQDLYYLTKYILGRGCQTGKHSVRNGLWVLLETFLIKVVVFFPFGFSLVTKPSS